jgi:hypothetical protein
MTHHLITNWIESSFSDDLSKVAALTIRADGTIKNGAAVTQSAWSKNATGAIHLLIVALDRTVSQMSRGTNQDMKFVAFLGGDYSRGVAGHFHALLQFPASANPQEFINDFEHLWDKKASEALKSTLKTSVHAEPIQSKEAFTAYCLRYEGTTFGSGTEKVVVSRSLKL